MLLLLVLVSSSEKKLCIWTYRSSTLNNKEKMPVMIYAQKNDQTMVVCCEEHKIQAVPMVSTKKSRVGFSALAVILIFISFHIKNKKITSVLEAFCSMR